MKADCRKKKRDDEERKTEQFDFFTCCDESTKTDDRTNEPFWSQQLVSPTTHCPVSRFG